MVFLAALVDLAFGAFGFLAVFGFEIVLVLAAPLAAFFGAAFLAGLAGLAGDEVAGAGVETAGAGVEAAGAGVEAALVAFGFEALVALAALG